MPLTPDSAVTPYRDIRLVLDVSTSASIRQGWSLRRKSDEISAAIRIKQGRSRNVRHIPRDAWILTPGELGLHMALTSAYAPDVVRLTAVNAPTALVEVPLFRSPADLLGGNPSPNLLASGGYAFRKRVPAGTGWDTILLAAAAATPPPPLESELIPMDRIIEGKITYPENTPFFLVFVAPDGFFGMDNILSFYFGGPAELEAVGDEDNPELAGQYCLNVQGSGRAELFERVKGGDWKSRTTFYWSQEVKPGEVYWLQIVPYGKDAILFAAFVFTVQIDQSGFTGQPLISRSKMGDRSFHLYRESAHATGHVKTLSMTGPGIIQVDIRRDNREPFAIWRLRYPLAGFIVDLPVYINEKLPANTPITVNPTVYEMPGTSFSVELYDADTLLPAPVLSPGVFGSIANQSKYYCIFNLKSVTGEQTPVLYDYQVFTEFARENLNPEAKVIPIQRLSISGPDLAPDHETASVTVQDLTGLDAALLKQRARIPARIVLTDNNTGLESTVFQGEVAQAVRRKRGRPRGVGATGAGPMRLYPADDWSRYEVSLVGVWAKLHNAVHINFVDFSRDPNATAVNGEYPPWLITDILVWLLKSAGFGDDQIDVGALPIRLFPLKDGDFPYIPEPGTRYSKLIELLTRAYLASVLVWCPNSAVSVPAAQARGAWRLLPDPQPPYPTVVWNFVTVSSAIPGGLTAHPGRYPASTSFIQDGSYEDWVEAPEGNWVQVTNTGELFPSGSVKGRFLTKPLLNFQSFNFDPTNPTADPNHPDYLGYFLPIFHVDSSIQTQEAANFMARRIYDFAAHARKWCRFTAPMPLIPPGPADPVQIANRPPRINDVVRVRGVKALIRSCNPLPRHARTFMALYEGVFVE